MHKVSLGALHSSSNKYVLPTMALKTETYKCLECNKQVILKHGKIRRAHFAHYAQTNICGYYDHPNEAQIHKDAKLLLAKLLNDRALLQFCWNCENCCNGYSPFNACDEPSVIYKEGDEVVTEFRDKNNKWIADVTLINKGEVRYIFEIKNTHATLSTCRPEPWYEINAEDFINYINELMSADGGR